MRIHDDHMYHGAALIQIAEHPSFKAINSLRLKGKLVRNAYLINEDVALFMKYASKPMRPFQEYQFTFTEEHLESIESAGKARARLLIALVCVKAREICCVTGNELFQLVKYRRESKGAGEDQYVVLATVPKNKRFRVYVNEADKRKTYAGEQIKVPRNCFPNVMFDS